ncbi:hypothetical protein ACIBK8_09165 [Streptomyces sp. NPDC050161]|uniref:cyanobactin maturation protease PatG family protein n=1 Tax=Streptomyces sp. NPDC050161 TaxID=3365604 RepID=UPI003799857B
MDPETTETALNTQAEAEVRPPPPADATLDPEDPPGESTVSQACCDCATADSRDGGGNSESGGYVYVLGRVHAVFPDMSIQREFLQAAGADDTTYTTDADALYGVLSAPENRYIARQMCYVLAVQGVDTYILEPSDPTVLDDLVEALRPVEDQRDLAVIVGHLGPVAPPHACQGLSVRIVDVLHVWAFDSKKLVQAIDRPKNTSGEEFERSAQALLDRLLQLSDNAGTAPTERALTFLTVRDQEIYRKTNQKYNEGYTLSAVEAGPSRLTTGAQTVITVVFSYTHLKTNVTEKWFARVDVTGPFPFPVTPYQGYYSR